MDVTKMTYPDRSVDCVIAKATLDTMKQLDDDDDDDLENFDPGATGPARDPESHAARMLREACRVLKPVVTTSASRTATRDATLADPTSNDGLGSGRALGEDGEPCLELKRNRRRTCVRVQEEDEMRRSWRSGSWTNWWKRSSREGKMFPRECLKS